MNKLELVEHVAKEAELTKVSAAAALEAVLDGIAKSLKKGDEVRLVGFGTFSVRERAAGKGRNPATGKEIKIAASKNARFKAGAALKAQPQQEGRAEEVSGCCRAARLRRAPGIRRAAAGGRPFCRPSAQALASRLERLGLAGASEVVSRTWRRRAAWRSGAVSSVGRASRLHREGRRFEPVTAHQPGRSGEARARVAMVRGAAVARGCGAVAGRRLGGGRADADDLPHGRLQFQRLRRRCPQVIVADGVIEADTPQAFVDFAKQAAQARALRGVIFINSPGGNVVASMELGTEFRKLRAAVMVAGFATMGAMSGRWRANACRPASMR